MQALKRALFEDPLTIYAGLVMIEIVMLALWRRYMTSRRLLALAVPLLLGGAVFFIERTVVTDAEIIVAALEEIAETASADSRDLGPIRTYLDNDVRVDLGTGLGRVMNRGRALKRWPRVLDEYHVVSASISNAEVEVNGDSARARFAADITYRVTRNGSELTTQLLWTVDWRRRNDGWRIIQVNRPARGLGL